MLCNNSMWMAFGSLGVLLGGLVILLLWDCMVCRLSGGPLGNLKCIY